MVERPRQSPARGAATPPALVEPELDPPLEIVEPAGPFSPLVVSSPHSGAVYPAAFVAASRLSAFDLRRSEDAHVDALFAGAEAVGAPLVRARFPRAYLDVNREPYELDPRMFDGRLPSFVNARSPRVASGLGTIARLVSESQEIYATRLPVEEALRRIEGLYRPYHRALHDLVARARRRHGRAVLIDCHSMPSHVAGDPARHDGERRADIILGDRYGASCDSQIVGVLEESLRGAGYRVGRNKPYAGGYITEYFGALSRQCDAVQIEVSRSLYMDERTLEKNPQFEKVADDMTSALRRLAEFVETRSSAGRTGAAAE